MMVISFVLQIVALVCLFCAALGVPAVSRISLGWMGLALWLLSLLVGGVVLHPIGH